ncbi:MAG TPA: hypothetical protein VNB90_09365 [Cytophagaceae bacterium]|jgi:hypothetical protein|nr:hypothetical protein [Cytophagaceae bacterium]
MAAKMYSYYLKAEEMGGIKARAKLSLLTTVDSYQARTMPDSEDNLQLFEKAMKQIIKEFNTNPEDVTRFKIVKLLFSKLNVQ